MPFNLEALIWYLLLIDSIAANIIAWFYTKWYKKQAKGFYKYFPIAKGWCLYYLILVIWIGLMLYRLGLLP